MRHSDAGIVLTESPGAQVMKPPIGHPTDVAKSLQGVLCGIGRMAYRPKWCMTRLHLAAEAVFKSWANASDFCSKSVATTVASCSKSYLKISWPVQSTSQFSASCSNLPTLSTFFEINGNEVFRRFYGNHFTKMVAHMDIVS